MDLSLASLHDLYDGSVDLVSTLVVNLILDLFFLFSLINGLLFDLGQWNQVHPDLLASECIIQLESLVFVIESRFFTLFV
jgi:hypothetical protein